jgi:hypothetical protein
MPPKNARIREVLEADEVREILRDSFFAPRSDCASEQAHGEIPCVEGETPRRSRKRGARNGDSHRTAETRTSGNGKCRPEHYKVICISIYTEDLERLDAVVAELKRRGLTKANRSSVLRYAVEQIDLDRVVKGT